MTPTPVLLDCDPGIDDTLALIYLAGLHTRGDIRLVGVTTTAGNTTTRRTAVNAAWVLARCGITDVPVAAGRTEPLRMPLTTTPETHGEHGMGYLTPTVDEDVDTHWGKLWDEVCAEHGEHLQLIVTGPCTNLAAWLGERHQTTAAFGSVTIMGGAVLYQGNTTPTAEWNFWVDPDAAKDVFAQAGPELPITLAPLNVTEQMLLDPPGMETLLAALGGTPIAADLPEILRFYFEFHEATGAGYQAQIHDLLTCMIALHTVAHRSTETTVDVEADSELTRGTSIADYRGHWERPANARLVTEADIPAAWAEFHAAARTLAQAAASR